MREALLALPDDELVKTVEHWGALLQQMLAGDIEALEEALLVCGLQFKSMTTGQIYPSLASLLLVEPNFERCAFVIVDPQQIRTLYQQGFAVTQNEASRRRRSSVLDCGQECFLS